MITATDVLEFIRGYIDEHRYSPSKREILDGVGLTSWDGLERRLKALRDAGLITSEPNRARSIVLLDG